LRESNKKKLSNKLATVHGVLVEVRGTGVLIVGEAGIGKSECALELLSRGHKLVADDAVVIQLTPSGTKGAAPKLTQGFLYVRGLGAFRVADVFGEGSLAPSCDVQLVVELSRSSDAEIGSHLGPNFNTETILETKFAKLTIPVRSGRNLAVVLETAVKIYELWRTGNDASGELATDLSLLLAQK